MSEPKTVDKFPGRPELLREEVRIDPINVDDDGLVWIWNIDEGRWEKDAPINAKEKIAKGNASLDGPGGDGPPEASIEPSQPPTPEAMRRQFGAMSKAALRGLCDSGGVAYSGTDTKTSLAERLISAGVAPQ